MKSEKDTVAPMKNSKFKPRKPVPKKRSAAVKADQPEIKADLDGNQLLLAKLKSAAGTFGSRRTADSKSAPVEVAFGQRSASTIKKFGDQKRAITTSNHEDHAAVQSHSKAKEYIEPWDYENSNYPISLPLRLPNLGDPEILDKEEFEKEAKVEESAKGAKKEERRKLISPAEEFGLMQDANEEELFFFQLPEVLPFSKRPSSGADQKSNSPVENANTAANLKDLPSGRLGKMMVYRSGKVKMKIGDTLFDVSPGQNCMFAQDAAVISVKEKKCCILQNITRRVVVTPDIDALLESVKNM